MAELVDALDLGSSSKEWEFDSSCPHQAKKEKSFRLFFFLQMILPPVFKLNYFVIILPRNNIIVDTKWKLNFISLKALAHSIIAILSISLKENQYV